MRLITETAVSWLRAMWSDAFPAETPRLCDACSRRGIAKPARLELKHPAGAVYLCEPCAGLGV